MLKRTFITSTQTNGNGRIKVAWQLDQALFLATAGVQPYVNILDRNGTIITSLAVQGECLDLCWAPSGETLAVLQSKSSQILLWDAPSQAMSPLETNMKYVEGLAWSKDGQTLAVSTAKGNLFLYEKVSGKKTPVIGKHTKGILGMVWTDEQSLVCISADKSMTISNAIGDTLFQMGLKGEPSLIKTSRFSENAEDADKTVVALSCVVGGKQLIVYKPSAGSAPFELAFNSKYGIITEYEWFKEGRLLVAFDTGTLVVVSAVNKEIGQEQFQSKVYKDAIIDLAVSPVLGVAATCGSGVIKLHDLSNLQDVSSLITFENEAVSLDTIQFSDDGQFLIVTTKNGMLYAYLSRLPMLGAVCGSRVAYLTSMTDVSVVDFSTNPNGFAKFENNVEPGKLFLGPAHLAIIAGTTATFCQMEPALLPPRETIKYEYPNPLQVIKDFKFTGSKFVKEYSSEIVSLYMSANYAAVLLREGDLHLHPIDSEWFQSKEPPMSIVFPEEQHAKTSDGAVVEITCVAITPHFMIYATAHGQICHYDLDELLMVNEFKHTSPIVELYPQTDLGVKLLFVDSEKKAYVMSPVQEEALPISNWNTQYKGVLWDTTPVAGRHIFVSWDETHITTYIYSPHSLKGAQCVALSTNKTKLPSGSKPALLLDGKLICQTAGGKLDSITLSSHETYSPDGFLKRYSTDVEQGRGLRTLYALGKMNGLWKLYPKVSSRKAWTMLAETALQVLDIKTALRVYRQILEDVGMVQNLQRIVGMEDRAELLGHLSVIFGDFQTAQQYFLTSSNPQEALRLRRDLQEWEHALNLALRLAPEEVTFISKEYAFQLELDGKTPEAWAMYQKAIETSTDYKGPNSLQDHLVSCQEGLTRMTFKLGDLTRGMVLLRESKNPVLFMDCAAVLESLKQYAEAAGLLEKAGSFEEAAELWIKTKAWDRLGKILEKLNSPKIFTQYARAQELEGNFAEAAKAYEKAKNYDAVARILIEQLGDLEAAAHLIRKTRSRESARLLSKQFLSQRNFESTVEFYLIAGMQNEAFEIARAHDVMDVFAETVKDDASIDLLTQIALYYESKQYYLKAGKFHLHALHYPEALKLFLLSPSVDSASIDLAIETVGLAKNDALTHELIDFLMGETDGIPKDAKYIFKLYMSLGQYREAARTAIIIAREEQVMGNYKTAHDLLLDNYRQLQKTKVKIPAELDHMLMLLHSYTLVKTHVRMDDHIKGARMLIRVSNNISKFPAHVVPILTSTVVECHRAELKKEAFDFAATLMRPEYRNKMDQKFKRKIEQIVRRPEKSDPVPEPSSPCPYCEYPVPETILDCPDCKNHIPYCIASGYHMTLEGWSCCPECNFPALEKHFKTLLHNTGCCPMCGVDIKPEEIQPVENPKHYLRGRKENMEEGSGQDKDPNEIKKDRDGKVETNGPLVPSMSSNTNGVGGMAALAAM